MVVSEEMLKVSSVPVYTKMPAIVEQPFQPAMPPFVAACFFSSFLPGHFLDRTSW
jgi:hypothetical protein